MARPMNKAAIEEFFQRLSDADPEPKGELDYTNPYTLLVAVALSAQATDVGVNKATDKLFKVADTPEKMLALGEDGVREHIKTIGLFRNKAKNVIALSQMILDEFDGEVPQTGYIVEECEGSIDGQPYHYEPCFTASLTLTANAPDGQGVSLPQQQIRTRLVGPVTFEQNGRLAIALRNVNRFSLSATALDLLPANATVDPGDLNFQLTGAPVHGGREFPNR